MLNPLEVEQTSKDILVQADLIHGLAVRSVLPWQSAGRVAQWKSKNGDCAKMNGYVSVFSPKVEGTEWSGEVSGYYLL